MFLSPALLALLHRDSIVDFSSSVPGASHKDVMDLLVLNQYFDTLQSVGAHPTTRCILLDNNHPEASKAMQLANAAKS